MKARRSGREQAGSARATPATWMEHILFLHGSLKSGYSCPSKFYTVNSHIKQYMDIAYFDSTNILSTHDVPGKQICLGDLYSPTVGPNKEVPPYEIIMIKSNEIRAQWNSEETEKFLPTTWPLHSRK